MSVLDSILEYKEKEDAKVRADIGMIGNAFAMFQQARQNNLLMEMEKKKLDVDLGTKGLRFDTEGNIVPATNLIDTLVKLKRSEGLLNRFTLGEDLPTDFEPYRTTEKGNILYRKKERNIPAERFDVEEERTQQKLQEKTDFIRSEAQDTLNTIAEIEKGMNYFGRMGQVLPANWLTAGSPYYNWKTNLNKLLSKKMIDLMTQMKEASKTGATGFGQLSEKEGQILREASTAIKPGLSSKDAQRYLDLMKAPLQKILKGSSQLSKEDAFAELRRRGKIK